jgi:enoyl-CoA hydratase/carnithine racemase
MSATVPARLSVEGGVAVLTLDRPSRGNALSADLVEAALAAVARAGSDEAIHTLALVGLGRHFCTGLDLSGLADETDATLLLRVLRIEMLLDAVWRAPVRTVAIGHGRITGAGADLFAACDHRLLAADANLRFPGAGFGLVLGTRRLGMRVGIDCALRWVSEGAVVDAAAAKASGLATAILPAGVDPVADKPWTRLPVPAVDRATFAMLRGALDDKGADTDLAALARSASHPGLKARIVAYRERTMNRV